MKLNENILPRGIFELIRGEECTPESIGRSGSDVYMFEDKVLKITKQSHSAESDKEHTALLFLDGKLPVPRVLGYEKKDGLTFLLTSRLLGEMACSEKNLADPDGTARILSRALSMVFAVDIADCTLGDAHEADISACGVATEEVLRLRKERPREKPVFSHGDFCLPNIFVSGGKCSGFLDLGGAGVCDRWRDISMCLWSMRYNFRGENITVFSASDMLPFEESFFDELGIDPCEEYINYYLFFGTLF